MFVLLILCLLVGCLIFVPLMLIALVLRFLIGIALIPLRVAGFAIKLVFFLIAGLVGIVLAGTLLLIPLLPIAALAFAIWLLFRMTRRHPQARLAAD